MIHGLRSASEPLAFLWASICAFERVDAAAEVVERADHRLDPLRAQTQLFDQLDGAAAPAAQPLPGVAALGHLVRLAGGDPVVVAVLLEQDFDGPQIVRKTAQNLVLFQPIGHRNLHRAVERQLADVDPLEHLDGQLDHVVALQQPAAKASPRDFDLLGQRDFFLPREQRNLAHLGQIHPHRIVGPGFAFFLDDGQQVFGLGIQFDDPDRQPRSTRVQIVVQIQIAGRFLGQLADFFLIRRRIVFQFVQ